MTTSENMEDVWIDNIIYCGVVQCSVYKSINHWTYKVMVCGSINEGKAATEQEAKKDAILSANLRIATMESDFKQFLEITK